MTRPLFVIRERHEKILEASRKSSSFTSRKRFFGIGYPHAFSINDKEPNGEHTKVIFRCDLYANKC